MTRTEPFLRMKKASCAILCAALLFLCLFSVQAKTDSSSSALYDEIVAVFDARKAHSGGVKTLLTSPDFLSKTGEANCSTFTDWIALAMGRFIDQKTEGGVVIGPQWAANDGLVNTYSARCPFGEASVRCTINGIPRPGVWNVLPAVKLDHLEIQGGVNPFLRDKLRVLYKGLLELMARERT